MPAPGSSYGLGVMLQAEFMGHAGGIAGFRSLLSYLPEADTVVVMLHKNDGVDPEQNLANLLTPVLPIVSLND